MANIEIVLNIPEELWDFLRPSLDMYRTNIQDKDEVLDRRIDYPTILQYCPVRISNALKRYFRGDWYDLTLRQLLDADIKDGYHIGKKTASQFEDFKVIVKQLYNL